MAAHLQGLYPFMFLATAERRAIDDVTRLASFT